MKEYKCKITTTLFWTACGLCAGWFVFNFIGRITHSFIIATITGIIVVLGFLFKTYYCDNISIILTDDKKLLLKRFGKIIKVFDTDEYNWSEYSQHCSTKNVEDQDIYYINKETGNEDYIDATNFSSEDYEEILKLLGAKNANEEPIKVDTIKK